MAISSDFLLKYIHVHLGVQLSYLATNPPITWLQKPELDSNKQTKRGQHLPGLFFFFHTELSVLNFRAVSLWMVFSKIHLNTFSNLTQS